MGSILFHACLKPTSTAKLSKGRWNESLQPVRQKVTSRFKDLFIKQEMLCTSSLILPSSEFTLSMACLAPSATGRSNSILQNPSDALCKQLQIPAPQETRAAAHSQTESSWLIFWDVKWRAVPCLTASEVRAQRAKKTGMLKGEREK